MLCVLPAVLPLFTATFLAALSKVISDRVSQVIAMACASAVLLINLKLISDSATQPIVYWFGNWRPRQGLALGISFVVDPLGAGLAAFASFLTVAAFWFSSEYFDSAGHHFHSLMLAFLGAMCGFVLTGDLFNLFVFFELMSAAAFALCGYKTDDPGSVQGALNFAVTNTIAAYFVLTGIGLIYARTSALNMAQAGLALAKGPLDSLVVVGFVFLVCGYLVKAAVVPFHFWLADAHAVAPTPVCLLFSGVMVEMGVFAFARLYWAVFHPALHTHRSALTALFVAIGFVTAFTGALMCYLQRNFKRLLAFSTISHVGLLVAGVGVFSPEGLAGAAIYTVGHGLIKGSLFLIAGILLHRFESVDEQDLHGRAIRQWGVGIVLLLSAFGLAGLPFSGLAIGHDLMTTATKHAGLAWLDWAFVLPAAITAAAVLRAGGRIFLGWGPVREDESPRKQEEKPETQEGHDRIPVTMFLPAALLAAGGLSLGFIPALQSNVLSAAQQFENSGAYAAHVLEGTPYLALPAIASVPTHWLSGLLSIFFACAITAVDLSTSRMRKVFVTLGKPFELLHKLHSGHVGDYVVFLTLGMAIFGLICVYCLQPGIQ